MLLYNFINACTTYSKALCLGLFFYAPMWSMDSACVSCQREKEVRGFFELFKGLPLEIKQHITQLVIADSLTTTVELTRVLSLGDRVMKVSLSDDGKLIFTQSTRGAVYLCSTETGQVIKKFEGGWTSFSPRENLVLSGSLDGKVCLWDASSDSLLAKLPQHRRAVSFVALSPDGTSAFTCTSSGIACLWDVTSQDLLVGFECGQVPCLVLFSPQGETAFISLNGGTACLSNFRSEKNDAKLLRGYKGFILSATFNSDGKVLLTCSEDGKACLWDVSSADLLLSLQFHGPACSGALSNDGKSVFIGLYDGAAYVLNSNKARPITLLKGHTQLIASAAFSPDGKKILTGSLDGTVRLWDVSSGILLNVLRGSRHSCKNCSVGFSLDGKTIVTSNGRVFLWRLVSLDACSEIVKNGSLLDAWFIAWADRAKRARGSFVIGENSTLHELFMLVSKDTQDKIVKWYSAAIK